MICGRAITSAISTSSVPKPCIELSFGKELNGWLLPKVENVDFLNTVSCLDVVRFVETFIACYIDSDLFWDYFV